MLPESSEPKTTSLTRFGTALLSELHGHDLPLHHHPFTVGTYGERPTLPCLLPDFATPAMALHTMSA